MSSSVINQLWGFSTLTLDVQTNHIVTQLSASDLLNCRLVCRSAKAWANQPIFWKILLCRDHAFRKDQLIEGLNLQETYKNNWILKNNLFKDRCIKKNSSVSLPRECYIQKSHHLLTAFSKKGMHIFNLNQEGKEQIIGFPDDFKIINGSTPSIELVEKDFIIAEGFNKSNASKELLITKVSTNEHIKKTNSIYRGVVKDYLVAYFNYSGKLIKENNILRGYNIISLEEGLLTITGNSLPKLKLINILVYNILDGSLVRDKAASNESDFPFPQVDKGKIRTIKEKEYSRTSYIIEECDYTQHISPSAPN